MGRTANSKELNSAQDGFDDERLEQAGRATQELAVFNAQLDTTVRAVAMQIGYQLPADCTDPDLIQRDINANMRRSVEACLEVGRGLAVLKVACGHGNFIARLDVMGIEYKVASKFMQAASKFSNVSTSRHLTQALGNQSKLFEMLVLDDEQLEELELTGSTGELHLDKIATMSVKELRAALRERDLKIESKERQLVEKESRINDLDEQLGIAQARRKTLIPDEVVEELRGQATVEAYAIESNILANLRPILGEILTHGTAHQTSHEDFIVGLLCQIETAISSIRGEFQLKSAPDGDDLPEWMRPGFDPLAAAYGKAN